MNLKIEVHAYEEAAVLRAARVQMVDAILEGNRVVFLFPADQAEEVLRNHRSGALSLPTRDVVDALGGVKNLMFAVRRSGGCA